MFVESCNTCRILLLCPPTSLQHLPKGLCEMSPTRSRGSTNVGPAFPTQQRTAWWRSHGCIWSFRWTCLPQSLHHSASLWRSMCGQFRCCNKCNLEVLRLSRWSRQGCLLSKLQRETKGYQIWFQNLSETNSCALHRSVAFHIFHTFHHSSSVLWNMLNSASLLCTVWKGRKSYSSNQSGQFHSHANLYTVHSNFSGLLKHWFVRHNISEIDACHTLPHLCFWSFSRTSVKNSRLPLWLRRALQNFWAQHPRKMCGDAPGRSVGTEQH